MWFVVLGLIALGLKVTGHTVVATWDWMWVLSPFGAAVAWWMLSDALGLTQRDAMKKMARRKEERRQKQIANLGLKDRRRSDKAFEGALTRAPSTLVPEQLAPKKKREQ